MSGGRKHNNTSVAAGAVKKPITRTNKKNKKPPQTPRKVKFARDTQGERAAKRVLELEEKTPLELTKPVQAGNVEKDMPDREESADEEFQGEEWPMAGPEDVKPKPEPEAPEAKPEAPMARLDTYCNSKLVNQETERKAAELDVRLNAYVQSWITMKPTDSSLDSVVWWALNQGDFVLPDNINEHFLGLVDKRKWWDVAVSVDEMVDGTDEDA